MGSQKGITLVALVITIIVMLILAGVTISVVINGGLFGQAKLSKIQTAYASAKEGTDLAVATVIADVYAKQGSDSKYEDEDAVASAIATEINKQLGENTVTGTTNPLTFTKDGYTVTLTVKEDLTTVERTSESKMPTKAD